jgi:hypothetical protein
MRDEAKKSASILADSQHAREDKSMQDTLIPKLFLKLLDSRRYREI